jgi:IS5 family transposase
MIKTKIALMTGSRGLVGIESIKFLSNDFDLIMGKTRFKVQPTFGGIKFWYSGGVARYKVTTKLHTQNLMEAMC